MTRFTFKGDVTWGSGGNARSFPVMAVNQAGFDSWANKASFAVQDGVALVENTMAALSRPTMSDMMKKYALRYFLTGALTQTEIDKMKIVYNKTLLGLKSGTMGVKIIASDPKAYGYTNGDYLRRSHQSYHNTMFMVDSQKDERMGAIHIDGETLDDGLQGVVTMVHEATHKYAGTEDYCYMESNGKKPDGEFTDRARVFQNADSYAWFAVHVGRRDGVFKGKLYV